MATHNFTLRNIPDGLYKSLRQLAESNGRSLNAEILALLADEDAWVRRRSSIAVMLPELDRAREAFAKKYGELSDSVNLIREDRDSR